MKKAEIMIDQHFLTGDVDKRIFGSFIEHLGRAVYGGIYQEGSLLSDEQGFRKDTLKLVRELNVVHVVAGHDFHFGYMGKGNPQRLREKCAQLGLGCDIIGRVEQDGITISSTYIRTLVAQGEMERANQFLGHPHTLTDTVAHGKKLGGTLGFPTVNLRFQPGVLVPAHGVYATRVTFENGESRPAVTNIGVRPTVDDGDRVTVEGFILDFQGDLYGQTVRMEFYKRLRGERKFPSLEALKDEVMRNAEQTRAYFSTQP